jgi:hypothetical protein
MRRLILAVVVLALALSVPTSAQMPTAERWENVEWYSVMSWQFALADAEGPTAFEWRTSPESVTFMSTLMEQHGEGWMEVGEWFMRSTTRFTFSFGLDPSGAM